MDVINFRITFDSSKTIKLKKMKKFRAEILGTDFAKDFEANTKIEARVKAKKWAKSIPGNYSNFKIRLLVEFL